MRTIFLLFILLPIFTFSQKFDVKFLENITNISEDSIDEFMLVGYGFLKLDEKKNGLERTYYRFKNNEWASVFMVNVVMPISGYNAVDVSIGESFSMDEIRDEIISNGYSYEGMNDYGFLIYKKNDFVVLVSKDIVGEDVRKVWMVRGNQFQ